MGSSSIGCGGQNSLEAESLRPNSPLGEWINDDYELNHSSTLNSFLRLMNSELFCCWCQNNIYLQVINNLLYYAAGFGVEMSIM